VASLLDSNAVAIRTLNDAVVLAAGRPPAPAEAALAADARAALAAAVACMPPLAFAGEEADAAAESFLRRARAAGVLPPTPPPPAPPAPLGSLLPAGASGGGLGSLALPPRPPSAAQ
jgi:hypothetical protein